MYGCAQYKDVRNVRRCPMYGYVQCTEVFNVRTFNVRTCSM